MCVCDVAVAAAAVVVVVVVVVPCCTSTSSSSGSVYRPMYYKITYCEPVWPPSGKALLRLVSGRTSVRYRFGSPGLSLQNGCGLWTLSCDFVHHFLLKH